MKPYVFIARPIPEQVEAYIAEHCRYSIWREAEPIPRETLLRELAQAEGLLGSGQLIDKELLDRAPALRIVSSISVGYNLFDLPAMKERKVLGTNTPHVLDETVADLVFALILAAARRISELDQYVKQGKWRREDVESLFGVDVHHASLGIVGMGRIGEAVARRAKLGFGMEVSYSNRNRRPDAEERLGVKYLPLEELLRTSDFVVLLTPLSDATYRLIGREQLGWMKESAIFINASRGQTVDEEALVEALQKGTIRGAALDVFEAEPIDAEHPLVKLPNVITVPHIGSATAKTRFDMAMLAARNLVAGLQGQVPPNLVEELQSF